MAAKTTSKIILDEGGTPLVASILSAKGSEKLNREVEAELEEEDPENVKEALAKLLKDGKGITRGFTDPKNTEKLCRENDEGSDDC